MRVLLLGPPCPSLSEYVAAFGDDVEHEEEKLVRPPAADWLVSFGYRHLVAGDIIRALRGHAINLHVSLLPWNRGADPNYWSWVESTPKGVSLHWIDSGVDTGNLIGQRRLAFDSGETLRTTYLRLKAEALALFMEYWPELRSGKRGSFHRIADRPADIDWSTPVCECRP